MKNPGSTTHKPARHWWLLLAALTCSAASGCLGEITQPGEDDATGPNGSAGSAGYGPTSHPSCGSGAAPLVRLTRAEYDNTVRDLFGDPSLSPADAFPPDENLFGFAAGSAVSPLLAKSYESAAQDLAAYAAADLSKHLPCDPATLGETECAREFVQSFGKRAFRRPLEDAEIERLMSVYSGERQYEDFAASVELVITAILQSPKFLYRLELGNASAAPNAAKIPLTPYEAATRLSYLLWQSMPDEELLAAADNGELGDREQVAKQARRLLAHPRAAVGIRGFFDQWLDISELETETKDDSIWDETFAETLKEETHRFVEDLMLKGDGRIETLLTSTETFVNEDVAALYGLSGISGQDFQRVTLNADERSGVLTQPAFLAKMATPTESSPIHRGVFVRERLLCQDLPSPPNNVVIVPPEVDESKTTRDRFEQHSTDPACASCHTLIDPLGFGFEHYDSLGRYRTTENGHPIDASGEVTATEDANGAFYGVPELAQQLAGSSDVRACMTKQWFRYAFKRLETEGDDCTISAVTETLTEADGDLRELIVALTITDSFLFRPAIEVSQ